MSNYRINQGDSLEVLKQMPKQCIDTAVTSPPYWGLRDYGVEGQLGLEETPQEYVNNLCDIFDELKRVLKDNGTFWLNLGDSYFSKQNNNRNGATDSLSGDVRGGGEYKTQKRSSDVVKEKDLVGIPWRVALEMQSRGWYLRNDIIWHKKAPMPESVTDRCTTSHEHIFLFAKSEDYYFDQDSIREPLKESSVERDKYEYGSAFNQGTEMPDENREVLTPEQGHLESLSGSNKRDVWTVNPASFPDAHFAVYPQELIKPCIKAGCPDDGIVLDPFFGAGTTGVVAKRLNRKFVGIELNEEYIDIAEERLQDYEWGQGFPNERELPDKAKFLTSVDGIGKKTAFNIWDHFNQNIHDIVTGDLTQVSGVGEKTEQQFQEAIKNEQ
jgi:DNA modification methylase